MRFYARNLTDTEQLNNFICDRSTLGERIAVKDRNEIYDISGNLTIGGTLGVTGLTTLNRLILTSTTDATETSYAAVALTIGPSTG
jgi:hypothetical protein